MRPPTELPTKRLVYQCPGCDHNVVVTLEGVKALGEDTPLVGCYECGVTMMRCDGSTIEIEHEEDDNGR
jgi:uncharacterized Zn finger protein